MKSLKGRAGVVTKGISETENVMHVWTKTIHRCAEITETMDSIVSEEKPSSKHKELFAGRVKPDNDDFNKIKVCFQLYVFCYIFSDAFNRFLVLFSIYILNILILRHGLRIIIRLP